MSSEQFSMDDYFAIIRRRKMSIMLPFVLILSISLILAFGLPPVYQSTATILIEQQEIPQDLVPSTVTSYAAERIQVISKRVMTRSNLWRIIEDKNLYAEERQQVDNSMLIRRLRENIRVSMVSADVYDPSRGRPGKATIAFEISFKSDKPEKTRDVVRELVDLFMQENIRMRTQKAEITSDFLANESNRLGAEISKLEAVLSQFKERNIGRLPEQMQMNMTLLDRTGRELETVERQLYSLKERKMVLESQLSQVDPNTADSPEQRLEDLQAEYLRASSLYSPDHPDVVRMQREIEFLKAQIGDVNERDVLEKQVLEVQAKLASTREKYAAEHPDVVKLENRLEKLNDELARLPADNTFHGDINPDNPTYISLLTQLEGIKINITAEQERRDRLREKLALYEARILATPKVEQEWLILRRDYDNAIKKYKEIKQKQLQAEVSEKLERDSMGERFSVIDPPELPSLPIEPDRLGIVLLGTVFSFAGSVTFAAFREFMDRTVRGAKSVTRLLQMPPLSVIPRIENQQDLKRRRVRRLLAIISPIFLLIVILAFIHVFWMPMNVIWATLMENF